MVGNMRCCRYEEDQHAIVITGIYLKLSKEALDD